jgi:hypothetical protein
MHLCNPSVSSTPLLSTQPLSLSILSHLSSQVLVDKFALKPADTTNPAEDLKKMIAGK